MLEILVYLYEIYYRPDACPDAAVLERKLTAIGFEEDDIADALVWLDHLTQLSQEGSAPGCSEGGNGTRFYPDDEIDDLGEEAVRFLMYLEGAKLITPLQREFVITRALSFDEQPIALAKFKVIALMMLWSQGKEPDTALFTEIFEGDKKIQHKLLH